MAQAQRLWDKGAALDPLIHRFTVGDDPTWDLRLVHWDCIASAAHARTLARAKLLTNPEAAALIAGLRAISEKNTRGEFTIPPELEDAHTAIEAELTRTCGEAGEKLHTARSRNDQVATAMRLYLRDAVTRWAAALSEFAAACLDRIARDGETPMPGYTHMQPAMPSSIGQWLHASVEAALDLIRAAAHLHERLDSCPLGTGAGFGVPLPLDREFTAKLLGFSRIQRCAIDVQNSRGRLELLVVRHACEIGAMLEKLASDLLLYSTAEFGFVRLPEALTTGSSIMPQKRNPDVIELLRGRAARLRGRASELEWIVGKLPSSYHRDLQLTKAPVFQADDDIRDMLAVATRCVAALTLDHDRLRAAMRPELFATQAAYDLVQQGIPFRQAYRQIGAKVRAGEPLPPLQPGGSRPEIVTPNLLATLRAELAAAAETVAAKNTNDIAANCLQSS
ncbi:MAG: argininosuccinate lyase [Phycisphaerae bacterium]|nr:argininosuccinate lyase [Phycisphaerae bacterium]